jgi:hypothetical protein
MSSLLREVITPVVWFPVPAGHHRAQHPGKTRAVPGAFHSRREIFLSRARWNKGRANRVYS